MPSLPRLFALALAFAGLVPGASALIEDAAHFAREGHALEGAAHEDGDTEHGCSDCGAHSVRCGSCAPVGLPPELGCSMRPAPAHATRWAPASHVGGPSGIRCGLERPPRA